MLWDLTSNEKLLDPCWSISISFDNVRESITDCKNTMFTQNIRTIFRARNFLWESLIYQGKWKILPIVLLLTQGLLFPSRITHCFEGEELYFLRTAPMVKKQNILYWCLFTANTVEPRFLELAYFELPLISKWKSGPCFNMKLWHR